MLLGCRGRVVVTGIGKSGHIARKLAATLASTGTPAFFVHAAEASHGDLGMITNDDVVVLLSHSGETDELVSLVPHLKRQGAKLIALTGSEQSSLAQSVDVHLDAGVCGDRVAGFVPVPHCLNTGTSEAESDAPDAGCMNPKVTFGQVPPALFQQIEFTPVCAIVSRLSGSGA